MNISPESSAGSRRMSFEEPDGFDAPPINTYTGRLPALMPLSPVPALALLLLPPLPELLTLPPPPPPPQPINADNAAASAQAPRMRNEVIHRKFYRRKL